MSMNEIQVTGHAEAEKASLHDKGRVLTALPLHERFTESLFQIPESPNSSILLSEPVPDPRKPNQPGGC